MRVLRTTIVGAVFLLGSAGVFAAGQMDQMPMQQPTMPRPGLPPINGGNPNNGDALPPSVVERQAKMRNNDRQKQLVNDTNKLLDLATQLKQEMDKSGSTAPPDDLLRKADEIEKLAKSVKDRMKG